MPPLPPPTSERERERSPLCTRGRGREREREQGFSPASSLWRRLASRAFSARSNAAPLVCAYLYIYMCAVLAALARSVSSPLLSLYLAVSFHYHRRACAIASVLHYTLAAVGVYIKYIYARIYSSGPQVVRARPRRTLARPGLLRWESWLMQQQQQRRAPASGSLRARTLSTRAHIHPVSRLM